MPIPFIPFPHMQAAGSRGVHWASIARFAVGGLCFEFCVFVVGWGHAHDGGHCLPGLHTACLACTLPAHDDATYAASPPPQENGGNMTFFAQLAAIPAAILLVAGAIVQRWGHQQFRLRFVKQKQLLKDDDLPDDLERHRAAAAAATDAALEVRDPTDVHLGIGSGRVSRGQLQLPSSGSMLRRARASGVR